MHNIARILTDRAISFSVEVILNYDSKSHNNSIIINTIMALDDSECKHRVINLCQFLYRKRIALSALKVCN